MAKAVVYSVLSTAFVLFLISKPIKQPNLNNNTRLTSRRLGYKFSIPTFDPLVTQMKRIIEENKHNHHTEADDIEKDARDVEIEDDYESFSNKGKLNITMTLLYLFPLIDNAPKDEVVSLKELEDWNIQQAIDRLEYRTEKEMVFHDENEDQFISFEEYLPQFSKQDIEKNGMGDEEAGRWKQHFMNADGDRDGVLNFVEFNNFLHPEDSNNDIIQQWLLREKLENMDDDKDGKINFEEFTENSYFIYKSYLQYEADRPNFPTPQEKFDELDANKNKVLEVEELKPIFIYLHPGEVSDAKYYSKYLIREADDNKDGNLSLNEMLNHEYIFYTTIYNDEDDEDDEDYEDYYLHDEL